MHVSPGVPQHDARCIPGPMRGVTLEEILLRSVYAGDAHYMTCHVQLNI
jgi:hypothetical protein